MHDLNLNKVKIKLKYQLWHSFAMVCNNIIIIYSRSLLISNYWLWEIIYFNFVYYQESKSISNLGIILSIHMRIRSQGGCFVFAPPYHLTQSNLSWHILSFSFSWPDFIVTLHVSILKYTHKLNSLKSIVH